MNTPTILIFYGLPGAGKNYSGRVLAEETGAHFHDADEDLTAEMRHYIDNRIPLTDAVRDRYYAVMAARIGELSLIYPRLIVAQALIRRRHRQMIAEAHPQAAFVWIRAPRSLRTERLARRDAHPVGRIGEGYAAVIEGMFEPPPPGALVLHNDAGPQRIVEQARALGLV